MWAAVLFLFVLVAGCGSTAWEQPDVSSIQLVADTDACRAAATGGRLEFQQTISGSATLLLPVSEVDRHAFAECMRHRGYEQRFID